MAIFSAILPIIGKTILGTAAAAATSKVLGGGGSSSRGGSAGGGGGATVIDSGGFEGLMSPDTAIAPQEEIHVAETYKMEVESWLPKEEEED